MQQPTRDHLEDLHTDERIILKKDLQVGWGSMDWIGQAQDRDRWQSFINVVMNLHIPKNVGNFLTS